MTSKTLVKMKREKELKKKIKNILKFSLMITLFIINSYLLIDYLATI